MSGSVYDTLGSALCLSVRSFRKDGTPVDTPLWVVPIDGKFGLFTDKRSHKFKRLRRNLAVEVAACDVWGVSSTPWYPARCRFVEEPAQRERIYAAIASKYGIHWTMSTFLSRLSGRIKHRVVLEIALD